MQCWPLWLQHAHRFFLCTIPSRGFLGVILQPLCISLLSFSESPTLMPLQQQQMTALQTLKIYKFPQTWEYLQYTAWSRSQCSVLLCMQPWHCILIPSGCTDEHTEIVLYHLNPFFRNGNSQSSPPPPLLDFILCSYIMCWIFFHLTTILSDPYDAEFSDAVSVRRQLLATSCLTYRFHSGSVRVCHKWKSARGPARTLKTKNKSQNAVYWKLKQ